MDPFSPFAQTGLNPGSGPSTTVSAQAGGNPAINSSAGPSSADNATLYSPDHPLFWAGVFIAVTYGLIGFNNTVRVGKFKASVTGGKS